VATFVADKSLRRVALPVIQSLDSERQRVFLSLVKERIGSDALRLP
jgi:hypothetical protein